MMESVPSIAPRWPPLTGASSALTPTPASAGAISSWETSGEMVLMSMASWPERAPSTTPLGPSTTSRTSGESGSIVMTMSLCSATPFGEVPSLAPAAISSSIGGRDRECTLSSHPNWSRRNAIGLPMMPRPMKPIRSGIPPHPNPLPSGTRGNHASGTPTRGCSRPSPRLALSALHPAGRPGAPPRRD